MTKPAPNHSIFYRPSVLHDAQPTVSKQANEKANENPDWFNLSGAGLPRLSWKAGH